MTDLLDQLADLNPVPSCEAPSIDHVWRRLDALGDELDGYAPGDGRAGANPSLPDRRVPRPRGSDLFARGRAALPALVAVVVCLVVVIVAVTGPRSDQADSGVGSQIRSLPAWNATDGQRPSLRALMAHFAVLRRPSTAAERAAAPRFAVGVGTAGRTQYPTFVRLAGEANGIPVYFVIYANHRHGATGPVTGYSMQIIAGAGSPYAASNYTIFPNVETSDSGTRSEYLSVVPDGVRTVRWRFACASNARGCVLPAARRTVSVPVRGNLAVFPVRAAKAGRFYAGAVSVTWYRADGTETTYTDQNAAVPFPGAPAWPSVRRGRHHLTRAQHRP